MARLVADRLSARLGQPVVPENRPGAGAMIAAENVARAPADGYSLLFMSNSLLAAAATMPRPAVEVARDLAPVSGLAEGPLLLVASPSAPFDTIQAMVAWARANPGKLNVGVPGAGTANHLALELMARRLGLEVTVVPYQGNAPAMTALIRGDIPVISDNLLTSTAFIRDGKVRALAVTGARRSALVPEVPTVAESVLPDYAVTFWSSLLCAAGTPAPVLERLEREVTAIMAQPDILATIQAQGFEPMARGAASLRDRIVTETGLWGRVAREAGLAG
jgi:tripartite-type tricarboxylate transporter receptor subunit TctC